MFVSHFDSGRFYSLIPLLIMFASLLLLLSRSELVGFKFQGLYVNLLAVLNAHFESLIALKKFTCFLVLHLNIALF